MTLLLWLAACSPPEPRWEATRAACGLSEGETAEDPREDPMDPASLRYDAACGLAIGDDLGVRWDAFPNVDLPGAMTGETLEKLVAGAWLLLAGDFGTVQEWQDDPVVPASFQAELDRLASALDVAPDAPASRLLYDYAADAIHAVEPKEADRPSMNSLTDTLRLGDVATSDPTYFLGTVLHEAAHHSGRLHRACTNAEGDAVRGDADWDGAYGIAGTLLLRYAENGSTELAIAGGIEGMDQAQQGLCAGVAPPDDALDRLAALEARK